ncbi:MAG: class I SAM-dependent methyltransferase [Candidatus Pacebacteria bacterium]|nr:class I SAM-dependent methyltransferase [Candidatus Paceibacterota bacterium]
MITFDIFRNIAQHTYDKSIVRPLTRHMYWNQRRLSHLAWKRSFPRSIRIPESDQQGNTIIGRGGLTPMEWVELTYLQSISEIKRVHGSEPFGPYPQRFLEEGRDGTINHPHRPSPGHDICDALPGLLRLVAESQNGIYVDPAHARGYDPLILITPDFQFIAVTNKGPGSMTLLSFIFREALAHPHLMRRRSAGRFDETIQWYKQHAKQYAEAISGAVSEDQINAFAEHLSTGSNILDVGANGGRDEKQFTDRGYHVTGLDLAYESLEIAKDGNPGNLQVNCNMLATPFPNNSFDGVWTHASLHHLNSLGDFRAAIDEQKRVLRPGGILHIATQAKIDQLRTAIVVDELTREPRQYLYVTSKELTAILQQKGFSIIDLKEHGEVDDQHGTKRKAVRWLVALARKN